MTLHYVDKKVPEKGGYEVITGADGFRWHWEEHGREGEIFHDFGPWETSEEMAYLGAADDWDDNGDGGRLAGQLTAAATRARKKRTS